MTRIAALESALLCTALLLAPPHVSAEGCTAQATVAQLAEELRALKREVMRLRIDAATTRLSESERHWRDAKLELQRLDEEDRSLSQEMQELDSQLLQPNLSPEARAEILQAKLDAQNTGMAALRDERADASRREAAARASYRQAQHAHCELLAEAAQLGLSP
jgi:hypothetical protein